MSRIRTKPAESARKRDVFRDPQQSTGRATRAECLPPGPLLEYISHLGGHLKWVNTFYGGEMRAG
jgi:hypothetical protein